MVRVYREAVSCHKFNTLHQRIEGECVMLGQGKMHTNACVSTIITFKKFYVTATFNFELAA